VAQFATAANAGITFKLGPHPDALFNPRASKLGLAVRKGAWHFLVVALAPAIHKILAQLYFKTQALVDVVAQLAASKAQNNVRHSILAPRCAPIITTVMRAVL
jgi:hypothetical protein